MITAHIDLRALQAELMQRARRVPQAVAAEAKVIMQDNSAASKNIEGKRLPKYSKGYAAFRRKNGLSTTPDTRFTGDLLDNAKVEFADMRSSVRPNAPDLKKAQGIQQARKLYPDTEADMQRHTKRLSAAAERVMGG